MTQQFSRKKVALLCGLAIFISPNAFSQNNVSVNAAPSTLNPIIVTATRTPTKAEDVLADFVYIGPEEIAQAAQTSLADLLQQQRGIQISGYGGNGNLTNINLRGTSNSQSLLLIDGVRVDSSAAGGPILNQIPLALIDHIEIVFGAQSTLYGANAIGGVIQVFTKNGGGPTQFTASSGYGSYGTSINNAAITGSLGDANKTKYSLGFSQEHSAGFNTVASNNPCSSQNQVWGCLFPISATGYTRLGTTAQLSQEWQPGQELGIKVFATSNNYQYPNSTSQSTYQQYIGAGYEPFYGQQVNRFSTITGYSKNKINEIWESNFQMSAISNSQQVLWSNVGPNSANDKIDMPEYDFLWQNNIKVGADTLQILVERRNQYVYSSNSYNITGCDNSTTNCIVNQKRFTNSIAGSYDLKRGNHLATFSLRNDSITGFNPKTTGGAAYGYFFTPQWRGNLNYSTGYRVPTFNDMYYPGQANPNLVPETSQNAEVGLTYETKTSSNKIVAYQNKITNYIEPNLSNPANPCTLSSCMPINIGSAMIKGLSGGSTNYIGNLMLRGTVDYLHAVDQNTDLYLPRRAKLTSNLALEYRMGKVNLGTNVTYTGQTYDTLYNSSLYTNNPYTLLSLYGSYEIDLHWKAFARWNNVTNVQYQTVYGYNNMGSNIFAGVSYSYR
jgi:vitamin B12 transporter